MNPSEETPLAFPIGSPNYIGKCLDAKERAITRLLERITRVASRASPSLPIRLALNCLLRSCISQKCNHFLRKILPAHTDGFAQRIDGHIVTAIVDTF